MSDPEAPEPTDLEVAVRADLDSWGLTNTSLAAATLDVVGRLADPELRPAAAAMLHQRLDGYLSVMRALAPEADADDGVSDLQGEYEGLRVVSGE